MTCNKNGKTCRCKIVVGVEAGWTTITDDSHLTHNHALKPDDTALANSAQYEALQDSAKGALTTAFRASAFST